MRYLCTLSDSNYILKALALHESLLEVSGDFILFYLCIDDFTYELINKLNLYNVVTIRLSDLENNDKELAEARTNRRPQCANPRDFKDMVYAEYCWCLTPYFIWYMLNRSEYKEEIKDITYLDSDLLFYKNYDIIYEEIGDKSVGIFRQRHVSLDNNNTRVGIFNVSAIFC